MSRILLVRHGETESTMGRRYCGHQDEPLNGEGRRQAVLLTKRLAGERIDRAYSSDLARARLTAEIILERRPVEMIVDPRLREIHFGLWEGLTHEEILSRHVFSYQQWLKDPASPIPSGESLPATRDRVIRCLEEIVRSSRSREESILVVTHGGPIAVILGFVEGAPLGDFWSRIPPPASLSEIRIDGPRISCVSAGDVRHLEGDAHG